MQGIWLQDQSLSYRTDLPEPSLDNGAVLVQVCTAGICNTDLEVLRGYRPLMGVMGHEFVGQVLSAGDLQGRRVVGEINIRPPGCACPACVRGDLTHCHNRRVLGMTDRNGAFSERLALPVENLHVVPDSVADDEAVFTEPLAAACEILEQIEILAGDRVAVVGPGKLGLLCGQVLALNGCGLTLFGRRPSALALARSLGLEAHDIAEPAGRFDVVVDCTGSPEGFQFARNLLRPRGTFVLKSTYVGDLTVDMSRIVVDEIRLVGSRCGPFAKALQLLADKAVQVAPLIEARYRLTQGLDALDHAARPGATKILIDVVC